MMIEDPSHEEAAPDLEAEFEKEEELGERQPDACSFDGCPFCE